MRRLPALSIVAVLATAAASLNASPSIAQDGSEAGSAEPGCESNGTWALCPGIWLGSAGAEIGGLTAEQDGITLTVAGDFLAAFDVGITADGVVDGTWSMDGNWTMTASGQGVEGTARVTSAIEGDVAGSPTQINVAGQFTNEGVFEFGTGSQRISNSHPFEGLSVVVEGGTCVEAIGSWELSWAQVAADEGWTGTETIKGDFTAIRQPGFEADAINAGGTPRATEEEIRASSLSAEVTEVLLAVNEYNQVAAGLNQPGVTPTSQNVAAIIDAADRTERALNALANVAACEVAIDADRVQRYRKIVTEMMVEAARWARQDGADIDGATLRRLVLRAIATAAVGPASTHPDRTDTAEYIGEALSTEIEARSAPSTSASITIRDEFATPDTVELLRAAYDSGAVLKLHDLSPTKVTNLTIVSKLEQRVQSLASRPSPAPTTDGSDS